jgi:hypothetical protein
MKKKLFITLASILVLLIGIFGFLSWRKDFIFQKSPTPQISKEITLKINYGDGETSYDLPATENTTAFSVLEEAANKDNLKLETKKYDFGIFVQAIGNKESTKELAWIYFVNGKSGEIAADKMNLKAGDLVEWKYIKPSF